MKCICMFVVIFSAGCAHRFDPIKTIPQSPPEQQNEKKEVVPKKEKKYEYQTASLTRCGFLTFTKK